MKIGDEGKSFGTYAIDDEIGTGGIAHVYRARDLQSHQTVALRVLHKLDADIVEAEKEGAAHHEKLSRIPSTANYVPRFFKSGECDGRFYVAMEFVGGATPRAPMSVNDAVRIVQKICMALGALHGVSFEVNGKQIQGVVHGDLKPAHIRIQGTDIKLLDFGFVKALTLTHRQKDCGFISTAYSSPEMIEGKIDRHGDLWAAGVILHELVYGHPPFDGDTARLAETIARRDFEPLPDPKCPQALWFVIKRMLAGPVGMRYPDAHSIHRDLDNYLQGLKTDAQTFWENQEQATTRVNPRKGDAGEQTVVRPQFAAEPVVLPKKQSFGRTLAVLTVIALLTIAAASQLQGELRVWWDGAALEEKVQRAPANDLVQIEGLVKEFDALRQSALIGLTLNDVQEALKTKALEGVEQVVHDLRNDTPRMRRSDWELALSLANFAVRADPDNTSARSWLALAEGQVMYFKAIAEKNAEAKARFASQAATSMTRASELLPDRPEPYHAVASVYFYHLKDYDKGQAIHRTLQSKGVPLGKRELSQVADMHKALADDLYLKSRRAQGSPDECQLLMQIVSEYRQAIDGYTPLIPFAATFENRMAASQRSAAINPRLELLCSQPVFWGR